MSDQAYQNIGECPFCRQGLLLLAKSTTTKELVVICDDCESQWANPDDALKGAAPLTKEKPALGPASIEEIAQADWGRFVFAK